VVCSQQPTELGPIRSRRRAQLAARALQGVDWETLDDAVPALRRKLKRLAHELRFEDAARLRDRIEALEEAVREIRTMQRLRALEVCILAPDVDEGRRRAFFVARGRVVCSRPVVGDGAVELAAGRAEAARAESTLAPEAADDLLVVAQFLRRPPPELQVLPLGADRAVSRAS